MPVTRTVSLRRVMCPRLERFWSQSAFDPAETSLREDVRDRSREMRAVWRLVTGVTPKIIIALPQPTVNHHSAAIRALRLPQEVDRWLSALRPSASGRF
jgi:hypothetical protein